MQYDPDFERACNIERKQKLKEETRKHLKVIGNSIFERLMRIQDETCEDFNKAEGKG